MFGIGAPEFLIICVVALMVLGPSKLPEIMRVVGKGLAEFRKLSTDVKSTLDAEVRKAEEEERTKERQAKAKKREADLAKAEADLAKAAPPPESGTLPPEMGTPAYMAAHDDAAPDRPDVDDVDDAPGLRSLEETVVEELDELPEDALADKDEPKPAGKTPGKGSKA